jgi:O-antigen ligase
MKKIFAIQDTLTNKISYYHLLLFLIALPFDRFYSELILISLLLHTLIHIKEFNLKGLLKKEVLLLQSVFLITLLGTLYTNNKSGAYSDLERQLAIFLFPLLLFCNPLDYLKYKGNLLTGFAISCVIAILYLYFDAFYTIIYYHLPLRSIFSATFLNHNFSAPIDIHASYLSLYVSISLVSFINFYLKSKNKIESSILGLCILLLLIGLIQLGSRAVFFTFLFFIIFIYPIFYLKSKRRLKVFAGSVLLSLLLILLIFKGNALKERFLNEFREDISSTRNPIRTTDPRMIRWGATYELIKVKPVLGYGSSSETALLQEKYFEKKMYTSYLNRLNAHNQFLSFLIKGGILALGIFLFTLGIGFVHAIRSKDVVFLNFMLLIALVSLGENLLDVNKGIFFYSFFFSLFMCISVQTRLERQPI